MHLFLMQALSAEQSELRTHSGRQPSYGFPWYPSKQEHAPAPSLWLHTALAPHGDGSHGVITFSVRKKNSNECMY